MKRFDSQKVKNLTTEERTRLHRYSIHEDGREYGVVYVTDPDNIVAKSRSRKGLQCKRA
ncbi:hypothetical protein M5X02_00710 [Paenibacillus alvei]|uniref:hypothetical protein n=1 Tax=Paenibacillus alvei TaxID=44250 RepID=UPI0022837B9F|nr:hypothetical protein [Paenibacillus alvei]MCY9539199.1 hypothetical protein [Paenibacillus alvei]